MLNEADEQQLTPLSDVDFGRYDAESDKRLAEYFLVTDSVSKLQHGRWLVLGRKGAGKTALYQHMLNIVYSDSKVELTPGKQARLLETLQKKLVGKNSQQYQAFKNAWKYLIFLEILTDKANFLSKKERKKLNRILESVHPIASSTVKRSFGGIVRGIFRAVRKVEYQSFSVDFNNANESLSAAEMENALINLEPLVKAVVERTTVHVLIDGVDDVWENCSRDISVIVGALLACREINLWVRESSSVICTLFLRTDLWSQCDFNDQNKMRQDWIPLTWDEEALKRLVELRIDRSTSGRLKSWEDVFHSDEMRQRKQAISYIFDRTMERPRDIIAFCAFALESAKTHGHTKIEREDIYEAEAKYSEHVRDELKDELKSTTPGFEEGMRALTAISFRRFTRQDWDEAMNEQEAADYSMNVLRRFFEASVIGVRRSGQKALYRYMDDTFDFEPYVIGNLDANLIVHPAFTKALSLKDSTK